MGWLTDIFSGVTARDFVQPIMSVIAGNRAKEANDRAAQMVRESNLQAVQAMQGGNQVATTELARTRAAGAPGVAHLSGVVAGYQPGVMTPAQAEMLRQQRMETAARFAGRLGGRSAVAVADDLTKRTTATFEDQNQRRADAAAGSLAGMSTGASNAIANLNVTAGTNAGRLVSDAGVAGANATTANGNLDAATLGGALQSVFARERSDERRSRYENPGP